MGTEQKIKSPNLAYLVRLKDIGEDFPGVRLTLLSMPTELPLFFGL
jgi:hypothetical protein